MCVWESRARHGTHPKYTIYFVAPHPGSVEAQRLIKRLRALPNKKRCGLGCQCRRREKAWDGVGTGSASQRHAVALCRVKKVAKRCGPRGVVREAREGMWIGVGTGGRPTSGGVGVGGGGTPGCVKLRLWAEHLKHFSHFCETARVKVQRLIKRYRSLPSRKDRAYKTAGEVRAGGDWAVGAMRAAHKKHMLLNAGREVLAARPYKDMCGGRGAVQGAAHAREEPDSWLRGLRSGGEGGGARAQRTVNMSSMLVTLDVSKLSCRLNETAP